MTTSNTGKTQQHAGPSSHQNPPNRTWNTAIELAEEELKRVVGGKKYTL
jgi:hypothetical protein